MLVDHPSDFVSSEARIRTALSSVPSSVNATALAKTTARFQLSAKAGQATGFPRPCFGLLPRLLTDVNWRMQPLILGKVVSSRINRYLIRVRGLYTRTSSSVMPPCSFSTH